MSVGKRGFASAIRILVRPHGSDFDEDEVQSAVERSVSKDVAATAPKERAAGQGPFGEKELNYRGSALSTWCAKLRSVYYFAEKMSFPLRIT